MDILATSQNEVMFVANHIDFGVYEDTEKWALFDADDNLQFYALDDHFHIVTYDGELPEDIYEMKKYLISDGVLTLNPDWVAPPPTEEARIRALERTIADQDALLADILLSI